ncbi:hypothetical protein KC878_03225 [Candidatus Saccharibacteria bacterium]|nr:hypothetical protein [Candidatus Saccharibacteria bacterium]MCB9821648.1 hypothetical protein [Candidatus Nomurabacteria bacterium]
MIKFNNKGTAHFVAILLVLLVAVVGYAGYVVFYQEDPEVVDTGDYTSQTSDQSADTEPVKSTEDIDKGIQDIEKVDLNSQLDTSDLDAELQGI